VRPMDSTSPTYLKRKAVIRKEGKVVKTDTETRESGAKQIMAKKAEILKKWVIEAQSSNKLLIIVENIYPIDEMNEILQRVIEVIVIALSMSEESDPTHLNTRFDSPISTLTNVLEFRLEGVDDFVGELEAIKNGRYIDENNKVLVLYRLANGKRDLDSRYVAFVIGNNVDSAMETIESRLGTPAVVFKARIDDAPSTYVVLMIPLTLQDLENGPIEMPKEYIEEIKKFQSSSSEVEEDG